ncbi:MAG TPA: Ig domain-containing protein, partial [Terriglobales bacterium]|nr:Ig domain-containing protein [Terriglobales bacterium]
MTASVRDSEASPASASKTFTLSIASTALPPVSIITTSLPSATAGSSYNIMLQASGGVMPYVWSIGTGQLPLGLSLNASTGVISGTPSASGSYGFTAAVKDSESTPQTASQSLQLTVSPPAPTPQPGVNWSTNPSLGPQFYVSPSGSDTNDGSAAHPWLSLSRADSA